MALSRVLPLILAAATGTPRMVVLGIEAQGGVPRETAQVLTDELVARVQQLAKGRSVLGPSDIHRLLGYEAKRAKFGNADVKTLGKVGATLGAEELVSGTIARLGSTVLITVSRFDVHEVAIRAEETQKLQDPKPPDLLAAIDRLASRLFPPPASDEPAATAAASTDEPAATSSMTSYGASQTSVYSTQTYGQPAYTPPPPPPSYSPPAYPQAYDYPPPATYYPPPAWQDGATAGEVAGAMLSILPYLAPVRPRVVVRRPFFPPPFF